MKMDENSGARIFDTSDSQGVTLTLNDLPEHNQITISFDLYIIQSWDGRTNPPYGPDIWSVLADGSTLLTTTFAHGNTSGQSYPDAFPTGNHPIRTGAIEINSLGYAGNGGDSVYHLSLTTAHSDPAVVYRFLGQQLQGIDDESWGIDNVAVSVTPSAPAIRGPLTANEGSPYTLNLVSGGANISGWTIHWGDADETIVGSPASIDHTYADGTQQYTVSAVANDADGTTTYSTNSIGVTVQNIAPALIIQGPPQTVPGSAIEATLSWLDPGSDTLTRAVIHWGDGTDSMVDNPTGSITETHTYAGPGIYTLSATAYDEDQPIGTSGYTATGYTLDATFGQDGHVTHTPEETSVGTAASEIAQAIAVQDDGKMVVVGTGQMGDGSGPVPFMVRYNADGSRDESFAPVSIVDAPGTPDLGMRATATAVAIDSDGEIYVGGSVSGPDIGPTTYVAAYNADGSVDTSFGVQGYAYAGTEAMDPCGLIVEPDGSVTVAGAVGDSFVVRRLNSIGWTYQSVTIGENATATSLAKDDDGRLVIAGSANDAPIVVRLLSDGTLDTDFAGNGIRPVSNGMRRVAALRVTDDSGLLLITDENASGPDSSVHAVIRLNEDGTDDPSYASSELDGNASSILLLSNGKALVGGTTDQGQAFLDRFGATGALDATYGVDGRFLLNENVLGTLTTLVALEDGRIAAAGAHDADSAVAIVVPETRLAVTGISVSGSGSALQGSAYQIDLGGTGLDPSQLVWTIDWGDDSDPDDDAVIGETITDPTSLTLNHVYTSAGSFEIRAVASDADLTYTASTSVSVGSNPPNAPTSLTAIRIDAAVQLDWMDNSTNETRFELDVEEDSTGTWESIGHFDPDTTTFTYSGAKDGHSYTFRVRAVNSGGESDYALSPSISIPLIGPSNLNADHIGATSITLSWADNSTGETGYELLVDTGGTWTTMQTFGANPDRGVMNWTVSGLTPQTSYTYIVRALVPGGQIDSDPATITTDTETFSLQGQEEFDPALGDYELTIIGDGLLAGDATWTVDWDDGSDPQTYTAGNGQQAISITHAYANDLDYDASYQIEVSTAGTSWEKLKEVTASPGCGIAGTDSFEPQVDTPTMAEVLQAFSDVYNNIKYEPYYGLMKGATATAETGAGNDWDQANLLIQKLTALGAQARFAEGTIEAKASDVRAWLGVKDTTAAFGVLGWSIGIGDDILFDHSWVQFSIDGTIWHDLDPSWKFKALPNNRSTLLDGIGSAVTFDDVTRDAYFAGTDGTLQNESPVEYLEDVVSTYMRSKGALKSLTLADVPYDGPIITKRFDSLPALPWTEASAPITNVDIQTEKQTVRLEWTPPVGTGASFTISVPDDGLKNITIEYATGTSSGQQWYTPEIRYDGTTEAWGDGAHLACTDSYTLWVGGRAYTLKPSDGPRGIAIGAGQVSERRLLSIQKELNDLASKDNFDVADYQRRLMGLLGKRYFHDLESDRRHIASLLGYISINDVETGLIIGESHPQAAKNDILVQPLPIDAKLGTDIRDNLADYAPIQGSTDAAVYNNFSSRRAQQFGPGTFNTRADVEPGIHLHRSRHGGSPSRRFSDQVYSLDIASSN